MFLFETMYRGWRQLSREGVSEGKGGRMMGREEREKDAGVSVTLYAVKKRSR